jgi:hypothetical protein
VALAEADRGAGEPENDGSARGDGDSLVHVDAAQ